MVDNYGRLVKTKCPRSCGSCEKHSFHSPKKSPKQAPKKGPKQAPKKGGKDKATDNADTINEAANNISQKQAPRRGVPSDIYEVKDKSVAKKVNTLHKKKTHVQGKKNIHAKQKGSVPKH